MIFDERRRTAVPEWLLERAAADPAVGGAAATAVLLEELDCVDSEATQRIRPVLDRLAEG